MAADGLLRGWIERFRNKASIWLIADGGSQRTYVDLQLEVADVFRGEQVPHHAVQVSATHASDVRLNLPELF
jgi:hypothetical protein